MRMSSGVTVTATLVVALVLCEHVVRVRADEDQLRRSLEKEILKHTISYLRTKLVRCLSHTGNSRTKRKVDADLNTQMLYEVDMEVMQNTRDFLYSRTLQCMKAQKDHRKFSLQKAHNKVRARDLFRPSLEPIADAIVTTTAAPPSNDFGYIRSESFNLDGRHVNCESVTTRPDGSQLLCRNLRIDNALRLPNWSLCPPRYDPDAWWQLNSIQSATFRVLDLEGLCQALGVAAGIHGKITDVKVAWDCDQTKSRLKWLNGKWAGEVKDNGFLRDLNCEYTPIGT